MTILISFILLMLAGILMFFGATLIFLNSEKETMEKYTDIIIGIIYILIGILATIWLINFLSGA